MENKTLLLKNKLEEIRANKEVVDNAELLKIIDVAIDEAEKNYPVDLIGAKLSRKISTYLIAHQYKAPKAIINLELKMSKADNKYLGDTFTSLYASQLGKALGNVR